MQLLLFHFYSVLAQFHIKRAHFTLIFPTNVLFLTEIPVLYFRDFLAANVSSPHLRVVPHAQYKPVHLFPSQQQAIEINNRQKFQFTPSKVSIFGLSSNDRVTV